MTTRTLLCDALLLSFLAPLAAALAQEHPAAGMIRQEMSNAAQQKTYVVHGQLKSRAPLEPRAYVADIEDCRHARASVRANLQLGGEFEFRELRSGCYEVRLLLSEQLTVILRQTVQVSGGDVSVEFTLAAEEKTQANQGFVSLRQLAEHPPKAARDMFQRASKSARQGHPDIAAEQYRGALDIFPSYAEAHFELGTLQLRQGHLAEARDELNRAQVLGLRTPQLLSGIALAQLQLGNLAESESASRQALAMDASLGMGHYLLASALMMRGSGATAAGAAEILDHLSRATEQVPAARLLSAQVKSGRGDYSGAVQDLTECLVVCPDDKRPRAAVLLQELQARAPANP